jgi:hypothetical protein
MLDEKSDQKMPRATACVMQPTVRSTAVGIRSSSRLCTSTVCLGSCIHTQPYSRYRTHTAYCTPAWALLPGAPPRMQLADDSLHACSGQTTLCMHAAGKRLFARMQRANDSLHACSRTTLCGQTTLCMHAAGKRLFARMQPHDSLRDSFRTTLCMHAEDQHVITLYCEARCNEVQRPRPT